MKIFFSSWMREADEWTTKKIGIPSIVLMENAARGASASIAEEFPLGRFRQCLILIGKGNNGGDGMAIGRILNQKGYSVLFLTLFPISNFSGDTLINYRMIKNLGIPLVECNRVSQVKKIFSQHSIKETILIDAIFGTGLTRPIKKGFLAQVIRLASNSDFPVAAVDIPSGLSDSFLPSAGVHIRADITPTFAGLKWSLIHPDGNSACGKIRIIDIGIPRQYVQNPAFYIHLIEPASFHNLLKPRPVQSHKGDFGHLLSIAGSREKPGAGILSAFSALKIGAGLVTAAIPEENRSILIKAHPELMTLPYKRTDELKKKIADYDCLLVGPGLGLGQQTAEILKIVFNEARATLVLDADALNSLAKQLSLLRGKRDFPIVLTPHLGEFSRLCRHSTQKILEKRIELSRNFAQQKKIWLILKGHYTLIASPEGEVFINQTGNAGMAKAGSGDVLSGMIAGMIAQFQHKHNLKAILQAAVFLHGYAADLAEAQKGEMTLTASDIIAAIPDSIKQIHAFHSEFSVS